MAGSGKAHMRPDGDIVLTVEDLTVEFKLGKDKIVKAVSGVSFDLVRGETLAVVGESGCGKSTLGKAILQLPKPNSGSVNFLSTELTTLGKKELRDMRPAMQMIFQDPYSSLNPRMTVLDIIGEGLALKGIARADIQDEVGFWLRRVGLHPDHMSRFPHEFSGGQRQRIGIARAMIIKPKFLNTTSLLTSRCVPISISVSPVATRASVSLICLLDLKRLMYSTLQGKAANRS